MAEASKESTDKIFVSRLAREGASCGELTASLIWFDKSGKWCMLYKPCGFDQNHLIQIVLNNLIRSGSAY